MEKESCKTCVYASGSVRVFGLSGKCRRNPSSVRVDNNYWCGEHLTKKQYEFKKTVLNDKIEEWEGDL